MPRYVVLNLADPGQIGPVSRVKSGLTARVTAAARPMAIGDDIVPIHDLFDMLGAVHGDHKADLGGALASLVNDCDSAEKIFLCTHGIATDTEHAFAKASGGDALGTWKDFGRLMRRLLPRKDKVYSLCLVMCYGARTDTYHARDLDHQGMIPGAVLKTSFAYKLFKYLAYDHGRSIRMTARTGAVAFDDKTGSSSVEQEAAIDVRLEKEEYLRGAKITRVMDKWKQYKAEINSDAKASAWLKVDNKFKADPEAWVNLFSGKQRAGKAYHQAVAHKNALELRKAQYGDLGKYGKIVYSKDQGGVRVVNKYGVGGGIGPATILYQGPFL